MDRNLPREQNEAAKYRSRTLLCPDCREPIMRRLPREGFMEEKVYPLLGYYPWECANCRKRTLLKNRGHGPGNDRSGS